MATLTLRLSEDEAIDMALALLLGEPVQLGESLRISKQVEITQQVEISEQVDITIESQAEPPWTALVELKGG